MITNVINFFTNGESVMFFLLALGAISGVVLMNSLTKVIHSVVSLAITFLCLGGLYILLQAEFVAMVQVLVYGGAITILMVFGIMMTKHDQVEAEEQKTSPQQIGVFAGAVGLFAVLFYAIQKAEFLPSTFHPGADNTKQIGLEMYNLHVIPFEIISLLLTVAFIGAIVLAKREEE
jgi:NADH-quinone oxidoreductase subunit J